MTFANPLALLWGLLAVPIVILYLRRIRLRRERIATGMIWEQVFAAEQARAIWERLRHPVSLALQLTVLALIVVALADPHNPGPQRLVLILDNSASMNATDIEPTRLAVAKQVARNMIAGLRECDSAAIVAAGGAVSVPCRLTNDVAALQAALDGVPATTATSQAGAAVGVARRMLAEVPRGRIVLISDGCFLAASKPVMASDVERIRVGGRADNLAITRLRVRRNTANPTSCEGLVEVANFSDKRAEGELQLALDGKPFTKTVPLKVAADGQFRRFFALATRNSGRLTARLTAADNYPADNEATTRVPAFDEAPSEVAADIELLAEARARLREADLRALEAFGQKAATVVTRRPGPSPWLYLVGVGVLLLASEWCVYQRRWIC